MTIFPRSARILFPLLAVATLSGCGVAELIASGASDGTKYVIRRIDEREAAGTAPGTAAAPSAVSPAASPAAAPEAEPPTTAAAPVIPVTRGEPLD
ncbi:hypothetical protein [Arenibaculum sp.]|uniref:hypothetical protein n=1 Tax=Arenibaculum sp. TaxID=2865862 RepID=UPI002E144CAC|nr:hypothetical protein [Arenibaculum sp.]